MENKNRPAFPLSDSGVISNSDGLTKRELIAAMAMQGVVSGLHLTLSKEEATIIAGQSIQFADELLKQLSQ